MDELIANSHVHETDQYEGLPPAPWCHGATDPALKQDELIETANLRRMSRQGRHRPCPSARETEGGEISARTGRAKESGAWPSMTKWPSEGTGVGMIVSAGIHGKESNGKQWAIIGPIEGFCHALRPLVAGSRHEAAEREWLLSQARGRRTL